jgi:hypothetical protein
LIIQNVPNLVFSAIVRFKFCPLFEQKQSFKALTQQPSNVPRMEMETTINGKAAN